ncbi:hypothetical protein E0H39_12810 [Rhizobium leguminosarum bv. viciae]|uniref:Uncharacterized protein n=1 Tax=Rhizobium leguminosarum TaxID=384 RepID=A0A7M3E1Z1_RHILE|nr:hypothetical protein CHR56_28045 [Rhizobium leguminosarum bv. viciae]OOO41536.1 hypothetical protein BS629_36940 [Rhizobium leguminosarum bv. viciae USDA 2370]RWX40711.1 hypothetical protein EHH54_10825 [Rhizobium leguminosarum]NKJ81608.1 hypothetical protein [Rhizobium leguminosarum bv. viciae]NKJ91867.1 hypothetical protein [Rhizobium leguminosarum bv. viciae]
MEMHLYKVDSRWVAGRNRVAGMCELTMAPASRRRLTTPIASPEPDVTTPSPAEAPCTKRKSHGPVARPWLQHARIVRDNA